LSDLRIRTTKDAMLFKSLKDKASDSHWDVY